MNKFTNVLRRSDTNMRQCLGYLWQSVTKICSAPILFSALKSTVILCAKVSGIGIISSLFLSISLLITAKQATGLDA